MMVPECMTGCVRAMEGEKRDEERNGGEVNYKAADSPGASPSLCSRVWRWLGEPRAGPCGAAPTTGPGRGVVTPLNTERKSFTRRRGKRGDSSLQERGAEQIGGDRSASSMTSSVWEEKEGREEVV